MANLQFTIFVVLFIFVAAISIKAETVDRTDSSPNNSKRNVLNKRNEDKVCQCTIAEAIFDSSFKGLFFFSQDECGSTTIAGILNVQFCDDGSTKPFTHTFPAINLDCNKDGIFIPEAGKYSKRAANKPPATAIKNGKNRNDKPLDKAQINKLYK
ncbi:6735_t:CDS:2 [Funneliformis caledonium]|uniref:6735_t:CDS:1 n=1 Tax=Funneliformis caledonium TaxID=1117310 RepID=A0A9N9FVS7_9GLOM|nr:6735_t:CDS:2 [Funneliformis caledonium]